MLICFLGVPEKMGEIIENEKLQRSQDDSWVALSVARPYALCVSWI